MRLVGIDYGLPQRIEPDAEVAEQVKYLRAENKTVPLASAYATYPRLLAHLTAALFEAPPEPREVGRVSEAEHRRLASKDYVDTRITAALVSVLVVPATFLLALRFVSARWALLAAALVACSLLGTVFGRQARPHAPAAALVAWAVVTHLRVLERGTLAAWLAAGAATGLALGTLQSAVALFLPLLAAWALRPGRAWLDPRALLTLALIAAAVLASYPTLSGSLGPEDGESRWGIGEGFFSIEGGWLTLGNHNVPIARFAGGGLQSVLRTLWWYEPGLTWLLALALLLWLAARLRSAPASAPRRAVLVVAAYAVPYLSVLALFDDTFERFVLPALPFLACFAAWGASSAARRFGPRTAAALMLPALVGCASSARLAFLHSRPDTLEEAADWVRAHIAPDEPVFLSPLPSYTLKDSSIDLPLLRQEVALTGPGGSRAASYNVWTHYQRRLSEDSAPEPRYLMRWLILRMPVVAAKHPGIAGRKLAYWEEHPEVFFEETGPGYFIVEDHRQRPENTGDIALQDALARLGTRLARFEPDGTGFPFDYQDRVQEGGDWPHVTWRTLTARTTGPALEVWHVSAERLTAEE